MSRVLVSSGNSRGRKSFTSACVVNKRRCTPSDVSLQAQQGTLILDKQEMYFSEMMKLMAYP